MKKLIRVLATAASTIAPLAIPAAASAKGPSTHWCRAGDPPIQVRPHELCSGRLRRDDIRRLPLRPA